MLRAAYHLLFSVLLTLPAFAQTQKGNAEWAFVKTDGAMVFNQPNSNSDVVSYLNRGVKVAVSRQVFGGFRKIRYQDNKIGYVASSDVLTQTEYKKHRKQNHKSKTD